MRGNSTVEVETEMRANDGNVSTRCLLYEFSMKGEKNGQSSVFYLQITDPSDPTLLYDYHLTHSEFPKVKHDLNLFCEFSNFSECFYRYLVQSKDKNWQAIIDENHGDCPTLLVQERTDFKLVTYLSLSILSASEKRLNEYLAFEVKKYRTLHSEHQVLIEKLNSEKKLVSESVESQVEKLKLKHEQEMAELKNDYVRQIEQYQSQIRLAESKLHNTLKDKDEEFSKTKEILLKEKEHKIASLTQHVNELTKTNHDLDKTIIVLNEKVSSLQEIVSQSKVNLSMLNETNMRNQTQIGDALEEKISLQAENKSLKLQIDYLNQQLNQEKKYTESLKQNIEGLNTKIDILNEENDDLKERIEYNEKTKKEFDFVKQKSKEVIVKLQSKLDDYNHDINDYKIQIEDLENENSNLQNQLDSYESQIKLAQDKLRQYSNKLDNSNTDVLRLKEKISEYEDTIRSKDEMIGFLENQLNAKSIAVKEVEKVVKRLKTTNVQSDDELQSDEDSSYM